VSVINWWALLGAVAVLNIGIWAYAARMLWRSENPSPERRLQVLLAAGYVFGCAFRSVVPVFDVPRMAMFDSWIASALVGRTVATFAELCFAGQWALMARELGKATASAFAGAVSRILVPLIVVAEICSWYSVLTTSNLGHVFEESIWGASAALVVAVVVQSLVRYKVMPRATLIAWCVGGMMYVSYLFLVDVPMYFSRWLEDEAIGRAYFSLSQGAMDALHRRVVSHSWSDWWTEVDWMTLYFSVAVWISISLIHSPAFKGSARPVTIPRRSGAASAHP
jgi:hypothetical protein